jgi:exo-beta-1,3-glucanase (GH17 family)
VLAVAVGNENTPDWGARIVPEQRLVRHAKYLQEKLNKPVTFCEGAADWIRLKELAATVDFLGIHSYPLHYGTAIEGALEVNQRDYARVKEAYPEKEVVFTELGWATLARDDHKVNRANIKNQIRYIREVEEWFEKEKIIGFIFEAFDEPWKGEHPESCERNWGLFYEDRTPKPVLKKE